MSELAELECILQQRREERQKAIECEVEKIQALAAELSALQAERTSLQGDSVQSSDGSVGSSFAAVASRFITADEMKGCAEALKSISTHFVTGLVNIDEKRCR